MMIPKHWRCSHISTAPHIDEIRSRSSSGARGVSDFQPGTGNSGVPSTSIRASGEGRPWHQLLQPRLTSSLPFSEQFVYVRLRVYMLHCRRSLRPSSFQSLYSSPIPIRLFPFKSPSRSQSQSTTAGMNADQFREAAHAAIEESAPSL
jgi:hypothetical protein